MPHGFQRRFGQPIEKKVELLRADAARDACYRVAIGARPERVDDDVDAREFCVHAGSGIKHDKSWAHWLAQRHAIHRSCKLLLPRLWGSTRGVTTASHSLPPVMRCARTRVRDPIYFLRKGRGVSFCLFGSRDGRCRWLVPRRRGFRLRAYRTREMRVCHAAFWSFQRFARIVDSVTYTTPSHAYVPKPLICMRSEVLANGPCSVR